MTKSRFQTISSWFYPFTSSNESCIMITDRNAPYLYNMDKHGKRGYPVAWEENGKLYIIYSADETDPSIRGALLSICPINIQ